MTDPEKIAQAHPGQAPALPDKGTWGWLRTLLILIIAGFFLWLTIPPLKSIIIMFTLAMLLAYLLEPLVYSLENRGIKRTYSILILYVLIGILIYTGVFYLFGPIKDQINSFIDIIRGVRVAYWTEQIKDTLTVNFPFLEKQQIDQMITETLTGVRNEVLNITQRTLFYIQGAFTLVTQIIIIPLIAFFILKDGPKIKRDIMGLIPNRYFEMSLHLIHKTDRQIGKYIRGQLLDILCLAVLYSIGFRFLHIPFYAVLGIFSAVANVIPYVGPIFAAIPPIVVLIIVNEPITAVLATIALFIVIQVIEVTLIQPTVVAKSVNIHPLLLIFAVLAGGQILGIAGMLFAVLLAGIIKVLIQEIAWCYRNFHLGKH